jgi:hypothetical protein
LAAHLDIRLVQTALDLVQVILTHRHRPLGLLLTELGFYLLSPAQAPAGAKRISNLIHCPHWSGEDLNARLWQQASERVQALEQPGEEVLLVWDGSVWEKAESQASKDWCVVRSAKARRLARRRKGLTLPHKRPPILVPGLHWDGMVVVGMDGPPTLAYLTWWTTRGEHATTQRAVDQALLERSSTAWGRRVWHIWVAAMPAVAGFRPRSLHACGSWCALQKGTNCWTTGARNAKPGRLHAGNGRRTIECCATVAPRS